jgi:hypothetical protein
MTLDALLVFADEMGSHFARQYAMPPITGRVLGWLLVCDPPQQTVAELSDALRASRTAVSSAISLLERQSMVKRSRAAGERMDRIAMHSGYWEQSFETPGEYATIAALARRGLEALGGEPPARRARLLEMAAFADFLVERMPAFAAEWRARRDAMRASGELPEDS